MTHQFHELYRNHLIRSEYKDKKRPILINNWEATYFDFNTEKLLSIAKKASELGIEMLVMDDGWFGHRNDDSSSLGDWYVNEEKLNGGLKHLVDEVNKLGLKFGIWFEPEMISPDSKLYEAHPDWAIQIPGRVGSLCRNQYVLDLTRKEVRDYAYGCVASILRSANIEYVKWDMNRQLSDIGSYGLPADRQGELYHRYVLAVYEMQERLVTEFPHLLLENCSGGGARFDPGMLYYSPQIWCSDDTDAVERLKIQESTAMIYPLSTMGAHVSDCPNHTVGRVTPFETRGIVASAGTFGYELNLMKLSEEEKQEIREQIAEYKSYAPIIQNGLYYRLSDPTTEEICAWEFVHTDEKEQSKVLLNIVMQVIHGNMTVNYVKLQGLEETAVYREEKSGKRYTGAALMYGGMPLPIEPGEYQAYQYCFVKE